MVRVLHIYPQLNNAGTEKVIMNLYRNMDRDKIQFDFVVQKKGELDNVVRSMGAKVFYIDNVAGYKKLLLAFYKEHPEYQIVHTHTHQEMGIVLKMAKKAGVSYRIAHSHNYRGDVPKIMKYYKMISSWDTEQSATHFLACSQEAANWLFPRKYKQCVVWNNAIDLEAFLFNNEVRKKYRENLDIPENAKVVCHVGRFAEQKNHRRILALLNRLVEQDGDIYALLVGVGPLMNEIKTMVESDRIIFLGNRSDIPAILSASDVFLFPSLYEGLGIVAVEAQASGIKCIASTNVPRAADIGTGMFQQIALEADDDVWLNAIQNELNILEKERRLLISKGSFTTEYNIEKVANMVQKFYLSLG